MIDSSSAMNAIQDHPKLKVTILLREGVCSAGSTLEGLLEVDSRTDVALGLGTMVVELVGVEELISKSTTLRAVFHHDINRFQGKDLPPSNICSPVQDSRTPLPNGYWPAREGKCSFPLKFHLPDHLPSSLTLPNKLARISFTLRSSISLSYKGETAVLITTREAPVVGILDEADGQGEEGWGGQGEEWTGPNEAMWEGKVGGWAGAGAGTGAVGAGGGGKVKVEVGVGERCLVAGRKEIVWLKVSNGSNRKISNPTVTVIRRLLLPHPDGHAPASANAPTHELVVSDTVLTIPFRGEEKYDFAPGTETVVPLEITVPETLRSIRAGKRPDGRGGKRDSLFEVRCVLDVKIGTGVFGTDIHLELPVFIAHPVSLPPAFIARVPPLHPTICPPAPNPVAQDWLQSVPTGGNHLYPYTPSSFQPSGPQQRSSSAMSFHAPPPTPLSPQFAAPNAWAGHQPFPSPGHPHFADSPMALYTPALDARSPSVAPPSAWGAPAPPPQPTSAMRGGPADWAGGQPSRPPSAMSQVPYPAPYEPQWQPPRPSSAMDSYSSLAAGWQGYAPPFSSQQQQQPYADPQSHHHPSMPVRSSTTPAPYDYHNERTPALPAHVLAPQADRVSHHLRDSSKTRGRSISPPRSEVTISHPWQMAPPPRPPSVHQGSAPVDSNLLRRDGGQSYQPHPPPRSTPSPAPGANGRRHSFASTPPGFVPYGSHDVLSPKAVGLPELRGYFDTIGEAGESTAGTMKSVAELERMVADAEDAAVGVGLMSIVNGQIIGPTRRQERDSRDAVEINKTLPGPPVPSIRTKPSVVGIDLGRQASPKSPKEARDMSPSVVSVKPSLLEAFEQAATEKERRKQRRLEANAEKAKARDRARKRTSSADLRAGSQTTALSPVVLAVPRSTTMPTLPVQASPTVVAPPKPATPALPIPPAVVSAPAAAKPPVLMTPITPAASLGAAASAKTSPRPTTTSLAPTKSALAEIDRLANIKADRVGAWLGGAALVRGRGDDSEGTIKGKRKEIVPIPDLPPLAKASPPKVEALAPVLSKPKTTKRTSFSFVPTAPHQQPKTPTPPSSGTTTPTKTRPVSMPASAPKEAATRPKPDAKVMLEEDEDIIVPARFATRLKKSQLMAGMAADQDPEAYKKAAPAGVGSARGGKGGKVADVTKIWATVIETETNPNPSTKPLSPPPDARAKPRSVPTRTSPLANSRSSPFLGPSSSVATTSVSVPRSTSTTASVAVPRNMIKSTSAPLFLNTAPSKRAMLSSTASLSWAKPPAASFAKAEAGQEGGKVIGTLDKSFSKAKLKELREKYGG